MACFIQLPRQGGMDPTAMPLPLLALMIQKLAHLQCVAKESVSLLPVLTRISSALRLLTWVAIFRSRAVLTMVLMDLLHVVRNLADPLLHASLHGLLLHVSLHDLLLHVVRNPTDAMLSGPLAITGFPLTQAEVPFSFTEWSLNPLCRIHSLRCIKAQAI